jgi:hypothetical protein
MSGYPRKAWQQLQGRQAVKEERSFHVPEKDLFFLNGCSCRISFLVRRHNDDHLLSDQVGTTIYKFQGDDGLYCPACWDSKRKNLPLLASIPIFACALYVERLWVRAYSYLEQLPNPALRHYSLQERQFHTGVKLTKT